MKIVLLLLTLLAATTAAENEALGDQMHAAIQQLVQRDPTMTVNDCVSRCDTMYTMPDNEDEDYTDEMCEHVCECEVLQYCEAHTHPPYHTHLPPLPVG